MKINCENCGHADTVWGEPCILCAQIDAMGKRPDRHMAWCAQDCLGTWDELPDWMVERYEKRMS